jgi:ABC-2 type transport system ATP-binding protein
LIDFEDVSKKFACGTSRASFFAPLEVEAVRDVSFEHPPAECLLVKGPSGAGKSVLLNLIAGFYSPDKGKVRVNGHNPALSLELKKNLAMVRCGLHYFDLGLSARDNLFLLAGWYGLNSEEKTQRVEESLQFIGIDDAARDVPVGELSAGTVNQLSLAGGLIPSPDFLLLDEPDRYLDEFAFEKVQKLISALAAQGMTLIIASSSDRLVEDMSYRCLCLEEGKAVDYYAV